MQSIFEPFETELDSQGLPKGSPLESDAQFHGEVDRITYRNDENGWTVLKVRDVDTHEVVTVTGSLPPIQEGEHLQLVGVWTQHATFGRQFKAIRAIPTRPTSRKGILRYLCSGLIEGIGDRTAEKIVDHFGLNTFKVLDENPGCLLLERKHRCCRTIRSPGRRTIIC